MAEEAENRNGRMKNRIALLAVALILLYAAFVQWIWGWPAILAAWAEVGAPSVLLALVLLVGTYFVRAHRIADYVPRETAGRFLWLFRVTQIHNMLNIMLPFRTGETSFPLLMRSEFGVPLAHGTSALLVLRLLDLHALLAAAGIGLVAGAGYGLWAWLLWFAFLLSPIVVLPFRDPVLALARRKLPQRLEKFVEEVDDGIPRNLGPSAPGRSPCSTGASVAAGLGAGADGVGVAACFGGALGGELSSKPPVHVPAGVGTHPAGIAAGGGLRRGQAWARRRCLPRRASAHLLISKPGQAGTAVSLALPVCGAAGDPRTGNGRAISGELAVLVALQPAAIGRVHNRPAGHAERFSCVPGLVGRKTTTGAQWPRQGGKTPKMKTKSAARSGLITDGKVPSAAAGKRHGMTAFNKFIRARAGLWSCQARWRGSSRTSCPTAAASEPADAIYGDHDMARVREASPPMPSTRRS